MKYPTRIYYTEFDKALMWGDWRQGEMLSWADRLIIRLQSGEQPGPQLHQSHKSERLEDKITKLRQEMERSKKLEVRMLEAPEKQISLTDPAARSMATNGRGTGMRATTIKPLSLRASSDRRTQGIEPRP